MVREERLVRGCLDEAVAIEVANRSRDAPRVLGIDHRSLVAAEEIAPRMYGRLRGFLCVQAHRCERKYNRREIFQGLLLVELRFKFLPKL
jgi:hypothetical protein